MLRHYPNIFDQLQALCSDQQGCCRQDHPSERSDGVNVYEDEMKLYIEVPVAGIPSNQCEVTLDPKERRLHIRAEAKEEEKDVKYHCRSTRRYAYSLPLSNEIDFEGAVEASARDGVLTVSLAKNKQHTPLKIDVKDA